MLTHSAANHSHSSLDLYKNPFYLHHNDHARLVLASERLTSGADFHFWKRSVRLALNVRNKMGSMVQSQNLLNLILLMDVGLVAMIWSRLGCLTRLAKRLVLACFTCLLRLRSGIV